MNKATSVQNIKNVNNISFLIEDFPMEMDSKLTIVADTDDDIFEFSFEGRDLLKICQAAGLFAVREKDQKIREKESSDLQSKYERAFIEKQTIKEAYEELFKELFKLIKEEKKDE